MKKVKEFRMFRFNSPTKGLRRNTVKIIEAFPTILTPRMFITVQPIYI